MSDLRHLYQEVIFDHNRSPRNYGELASPKSQIQETIPFHSDDSESVEVLPTNRGSAS